MTNNLTNVHDKALALAYSYIRFSTPDQLDGDSLRRQTAATVAWCERNGFTLDTQTTFRDLGRSGFHGDHLKDKEAGGLATFLAMIHDGKIPSGSVLIVENLDRLGRMDENDGYDLIRSITRSGVNIAVLSPVERLLTAKMNLMEIMMTLMEVSRAHGESKRKQELSGGNWKRWRATASKTKEPRPGKVPFWITRSGNTYQLNERVEVVRLIFKLAGSGYGVGRIAKHLQQQGIRPVARVNGKKRKTDGTFSPVHLTKTLRNPAVYGHCKELGCDDYFPAALTQEEWFKAQTSISERRIGGRKGKGDFVHLLKGLVKNRTTGAVYHPHLPNRTKTKVYITSDFKRGGETPLTSFPIHPLERAVCECVHELDLLGMCAKPDQTSDRILALFGEVESLKGKIAEAQTELSNGGPLAALAPVMRKWEQRITEANRELAALRTQAANPKTELVAELKDLLQKLKDGDSEKRLRVRSLIARVVSGIEVEFRHWGMYRGCWATVRFHDTDSVKHLYVVYHKPVRKAVGVTEEWVLIDWDRQAPTADEPITADDAWEHIEGFVFGKMTEAAERKRERKKRTAKSWHERQRAARDEAKKKG